MRRAVALAALLSACAGEPPEATDYATALQRANECPASVSWVDQVGPDRWRAVCPPPVCVIRANQRGVDEGWIRGRTAYDEEAWTRAITECADRL